MMARVRPAAAADVEDETPPYVQELNAYLAQLRVIRATNI